MGSHGIAGARLRADKTRQHAEGLATSLRSSRPRTLRDWPVSWRLVALIVLALVMGLVFGGLRVASAADSAGQFGRVSQLASLGQQVTGLVQALQDERDETTGVSSGGNPDTLEPWYNATDTEAAKVRALAAGVGGSFPANIQASVATVLSEINHLGGLRKTAQASQDALAVIANYAAPISDMITLNDLIAQGISDPILVNDVRTLNSLSLAKDEAAQQRALFYHTFTDQFFGDGEQQALTTALSEELNDKAAFEATATPAEQSSFNATVTGQGVNVAEGIEDFILTDGNPVDVTQLGISLNNAPGALVLGDVRQDRQDAGRRARGGQEHRRAQPGATAGRGTIRAVQRHRDHGHPAPCADRDARGGQIPGPAAAPAAGRRTRHRHGAAS